MLGAGIVPEKSIALCHGVAESRRPRTRQRTIAGMTGLLAHFPGTAKGVSSQVSATRLSRPASFARAEALTLALEAERVDRRTRGIDVRRQRAAAQWVHVVTPDELGEMHVTPAFGDVPQQRLVRDRLLTVLNRGDDVPEREDGTV